jgi:uncharacterized protein (TIGR03086 family)
MTQFERAQDGLEAVLAAVPDDRWDSPSACTEWTVRDIAGHVTWGQHMLRALTTGEQFDDRRGAPGSAAPGVVAGDDPLSAWRAARMPALSEEALARITPVTGLGEVPLSAMVTVLTVDLVTHTWDIASALEIDVRLDPDLVDMSFAWARANVVRRPEFFGPELEPPADADEQTRLMAYLGREARRTTSV